jgi:hypothetical protein
LLLGGKQRSTRGLRHPRRGGYGFHDGYGVGSDGYGVPEEGRCAS